MGISESALQASTICKIVFTINQVGFYNISCQLFTSIQLIFYPGSPSPSLSRAVSKSTKQVYIYIIHEGGASVVQLESQNSHVHWRVPCLGSRYSRSLRRRQNYWPYL